MPVHLIIDGYNLIRRSPSLSVLDKQDLERGRGELVRRLARYKQVRSIPITVVFDGWNQASLSGSSTMERGIRVVFSRRGQRADDVIVRRAREMGEKATIVTSDRQLQMEVQRYHATIIPSKDFEMKMEIATHASKKGTEQEDFSDQVERKGTRKRGPSRRLPKNIRRAKRRWDKL